ncbi:MAG: hypothetical protein RI958_2114 [Actinomycetota bacterium]
MDDDRTPTRSWGTSVVLADGAVGYVRAITPADSPLLLAFHERQPRENLYRRFFSPKPTLTASELEHFTDVDFVDRVALVLEVHGEFVAWASYERWPGRDDADVAFMVDEHQRGKGIAMLLLEHLAAIARSNGIHRFTADVLADNRPMLSVFAKAGWPVRRHFDSGVMELEFPLDDTEHFVDSVEHREHRADSRSVARLLLPRSIAVVGASDRPGSIGNEIWRNTCARATLPVYPVNPRHATVGGRLAFGSVLDIDDDVWLAVIASPAHTLPDVIDQCIAKRVRGAVVISATDGSDVDVGALVAHARRNGMRIIGPASMGIASSRADGVRAALVPIELRPGGIAISMQSGSLGASVLQAADRLAMGFSWFVSLGAKSDVSGNDLLQFWEDDDLTKVIAIYTETFGNPRKFARIARRVARRTPIVAVRTGVAAIGSASDAIYQQAGVIEVPTVREMLDTTRVLATQPVPAGPRVAVITNSRSPGVLAGAALAGEGLQVVEPPVQLDWTSGIDEFERVVAAALSSSDIDALVVIHAPPLASAEHPGAQIERASAGSTKPVIAVLLGRDDGPVVDGALVPAFSFPEPAAAVLGRLARYRRWLDTEAGAEIGVPDGVDAEAAARVLDDIVDRGATTASWPEAAAILAAYGVGVPATVTTSFAHADAIVEAAREIGHPVGLKASVRLPGRSAASGVALDLHDDDAVRDGVDMMRDRLGDRADSIIVQRMVPPGVDVRIQCTADARLGPIITVGLGGVHADAIGDHGSRLAPLSRPAAENLVSASLAGAALRSDGIPIDSLVDTVVRLSHLVYDQPHIDTIDLNPVVVSSAGSHAVDVSIGVAATAPPEAPLRQLL